MTIHPDDDQIYFDDMRRYDQIFFDDSDDFDDFDIVTFLLPRGRLWPSLDYNTYNLMMIRYVLSI